MQKTVHLQHAIDVAAGAHEGQMDKLGRPYFEHCQRVAGAVSGEEPKIVAYLHDTCEKGRGWTLDRLREEGFAAAIVAAVDALTRRSGEAEEEFLRRAAGNPLSSAVKQADLEDNLWQAEMAGSDRRRYQQNLETLAALARPGTGRH
jgi:(p)ppGpp synthase/HD superfamily hydrolase